MAFASPLNSDMCRIVTTLCRQWQGRDIYVACSGNFTVESILTSVGGFRSIHSNDVTLYSTAVGKYLTGEDFRIEVYDNPDYEWLKDWVEPGLDTIATLLLCTKALPCVGRKEPYYQRMLEAYRRHWPEMHAATKEKIKPILDKMSITTYYAGDSMDFINGAPNEAVVILFPPKDAGSRKKVLQRFNKAFAWARAASGMDDKKHMKSILDAVIQRDNFLTARDALTPEMEPYLAAQVQSSISVHKQPVYIYSKTRNRTFLTLPSQKIEPVCIPRLGEQEDIAPPLRLVSLTQGQLNALRSQYLSVHIAPALASVRLAVLSADKLIGVIGFDMSDWLHDAAFMVADFCVSPVKYKRLSKLNLTAALSTEVRALLMEAFNHRISYIFTTAFTTNAASMKYRGLFDVHSRKENAVNYIADAGKWSLEEGFKWWLEKHSITKN